MPEDTLSTEPQEAGTSAEQTTVNPSDGNGAAQISVDDLQKEVQALKEYKSKWDKVEQVYHSYPNLAEYTRKYIADENFQKQADNTFTNGFSSSTSNLDSSDVSDDESGLTPEQLRVVEQRVKAEISGIQSRLDQFDTVQASSKIKEARNTYTVDNGYPVNFKDVEQDVQSLLQSGQASDLHNAFALIAAPKLLKQNRDLQQQANKFKSLSSMTTSGIGTAFPVKRTTDGKKGMLEALIQATEQVGRASQIK